MKPEKQRGYQHTRFARNLRQDQTKAEALLWSHLRNRHLGNAKFRRQVPVGPYILDFVCFEHKLCVELDGGHHTEMGNEAVDAGRTAFLEAQGLRVLRFWNHEVLDNIEGVLVMIQTVMDDPDHFDEHIARFELR